MKKAQGLSMNVIIIAAISLLVLVIISFLVIRTGGDVNEQTKCKSTANQDCFSSQQYRSCNEVAERQGGDWTGGSGKCDDVGDIPQICCLRI